MARTKQDRQPAAKHRLLTHREHYQPSRVNLRARRRLEAATHSSERNSTRQRDSRPERRKAMKMNRMTFSNTAKILSSLMLATASIVMGSSSCNQVIGVPCRSAGEAVQYVVNLVNAD